MYIAHVLPREDGAEDVIKHLRHALVICHCLTITFLNGPMVILLFVFFFTYAKNGLLFPLSPLANLFSNLFFAFLSVSLLSYLLLHTGVGVLPLAFFHCISFFWLIACNTFPVIFIGPPLPFNSFHSIF